MRSWIVGAGLLLAGCSSGGSAFVTPDAGEEDAAPLPPEPDFPEMDGAVEAQPACVGLKCQQVSCGGGGATTSVSGTVYAPNGTLPLYNAIVYVPNAPLAPIASGATCDQCGGAVSGSPIVTTLTDAKGQFTLKDVPVGQSIPIVVQIGKWRRSFVLPQVKQCVDNPVPKGTLRLPKNKSEGDMPRIAVTTGGCDPLACILPKIGIDATEYGTSSSGNQKVVLYAGSGGSGPPGIQSANTLWDNAAEMKKFDIAMFSCECSEYPNNKTNPAAVRQFVDGGGRVFGSHYHYVWPKSLVSAWSNTATWQYGSGGGPYLVDTTFPKGKALADWLASPEVQASTTYGQLLINEPREDATTVNPPSTRWVHNQSGTSYYLSFNAPVGQPPAQQCGKWVHAGMHVGSGGGSVSTSFPASCTAGLSAQEKALAFLFFDLSSCIQPDTDPPAPPVPN